MDLSNTCIRQIRRVLDIGAHVKEHFLTSAVMVFIFGFVVGLRLVSVFMVPVSVANLQYDTDQIIVRSLILRLCCAHD